MKTRKKFTREFKISILRELENGKSSAQISRENGVHPSMHAKLALSALDMALANREDMGISDLIHHSDQGVQYASWEYVDRLKENGINISMSRKGYPYDNAFAESFH